MFSANPRNCINSPDKLQEVAVAKLFPGSVHADTTSGDNMLPC